jgi:hypothetical protein
LVVGKYQCRILANDATATPRRRRRNRGFVAPPMGGAVALYRTQVFSPAMIGKGLNAMISHFASARAPVAPRR